jgi:hypothetical protein
MMKLDLEHVWVQEAIKLIETTSCAACDKPAEVHFLAVRHDGETLELLVCKDHLLDLGPLVDW